ncbi:efflux RND transporter periplasmic adaptor subunit [Thermincola potens]|uniref:Efflux transporter, RND family, MFP subunit n=1 Tax=Thermincola potens (strain JR) TaxID=635013 RepID=D5X7T0_THEPJ|nr:efflux RND transporter periplasmic adaptor subunit [Thermincola potens]ADG82650.1 efflux transporter, RND family, MFP subunit [Thermincola potens JR]
MKTSIKKYLAASIIILVLLGIFTGFRIKQLKKVPEVQTDVGYPVETITAKTGAISEGISYVGTVEPGMEVDLAPKISARILSVSGREGEIIKAGQLAVALDNEDLQGRINSLSQKVETTKISLDYWNSQVQRYETLFKEGAISEQNFRQIIFSRDTAQSSYEEAKAALEEARISLANSTIYSPMTGTIIAVYSYPGDMAVPGKPILTIADTRKLKVTVKVVEEDLIKLKRGMKVNLSPVNSTKYYTATITEIFPTLDKTIRTGSVEIAVPPDMIKDYNLKLGMSINVFFIFGEKKDAVLVPKQAVVTEGSNTYLYVVNNGKAAKRKVTTGISNDKFIEIISGLKSGEKIITSGLSEIYDGRLLYLRK